MRAIVPLARARRRARMVGRRRDRRRCAVPGGRRCSPRRSPTAPRSAAPSCRRRRTATRTATSCARRSRTCSRRRSRGRCARRCVIAGPLLLSAERWVARLGAVGGRRRRHRLGVAAVAPAVAAVARARARRRRGARPPRARRDADGAPSGAAWRCGSRRPTTEAADLTGPAAGPRDRAPDARAGHGDPRRHAGHATRHRDPPHRLPRRHPHGPDACSPPPASASSRSAEHG